MKLIIILLLYCLILCGAATVAQAGDDFLVPKGIMKDSIGLIVVEPVRDSLRHGALRLFDRINNGILHNYNTGRDTIIEVMPGSQKDRYRNRYLAVAKKLKLNDTTTFDPVRAQLDSLIREVFRSSDLYNKVNTYGTDSALIAHSGFLHTSMVLLDTMYERLAGELKEGGLLKDVFVGTCYVALNANVRTVSGRLLWQKQATVCFIDEERSMEELFSKKKLERAVKETFKSLF